MRHSLSYTHSDQSLLRNPQLDDCWDGLVVPGTLAAYYFEGTGGFVLTRRVPYVIDPRTPLLQTIEIRRPAPKASHLKLAAIHDPDVVGTWPDVEIDLAYWQDGRWPDVVRRVLDFQSGYAHTATAKVDKYIKLLAEAGRPVDQAAPEDPLRLVPPYWAVTGRRDPWWALTREAIALAVDAEPGRLLPIITLRSHTDLDVFADLIGDLPDGCDQVFCWASDWNEADATQEDVSGWIRAVDSAQDRDISVYNLYGGYLSVLLTARGLAGLNHGIGYSESRDSRRLAATGAPPTRYYVPALREFMTVPNAQPVIDHLPAEWACDCRICGFVTDAEGRPEIGRLSSEALKTHFLIARHAEFDRVDDDFAVELDDLRTVGQWIVDHGEPVLAREHGDRLLRWATAVG